MATILQVPTLNQGTVLCGATPQGPVGTLLAHITEEAEETGHKNGEHDLAWGLNQNLLDLINSLLEAMFYLKRAYLPSHPNWHSGGPVVSEFPSCENRHPVRHSQ